jgi:hypothetical protein
MQIDYEKLKKYRYRKSNSTISYCHKCCGRLEYCPIEKNLYCVRCEDCGIHTLIEATSGEIALRKVGENG